MKKPTLMAIMDSNGEHPPHVIHGEQVFYPVPCDAPIYNSAGELIGVVTEDLSIIVGNSVFTTTSNYQQAVLELARLTTKH